MVEARVERYYSFPDWFLALAVGISRGNHDIVSLATSQYVDNDTFGLAKTVRIKVGPWGVYRTDKGILGENTDFVGVGGRTGYIMSDKNRPARFVVVKVRYS